jgi:hypothetical protein
LKITSDNISDLTRQARVDYLRKITEGAIELDQRYGGETDAAEAVLFAIISYLDEWCEDDFGTEGWRHALLGED